MSPASDQNANGRHASCEEGRKHADPSVLRGSGRKALDMLLSASELRGLSSEAAINITSEGAPAAITIRLLPTCLLFLDDSENSHHGCRLHAGRRSEKTRNGSVLPCVSGTCSRTPGRRKPKAPRQRAAVAAYLNAAVTEPERPLSRTPEEAQAP